jgi:hypothetical protein
MATHRLRGTTRRTLLCGCGAAIGLAPFGRAVAQPAPLPARRSGVVCPEAPGCVGDNPPTGVGGVPSDHVHGRIHVRYWVDDAAGPHALPPAMRLSAACCPGDVVLANAVLGQLDQHAGAPAQVQRTALIAEHALNLFAALGFSPPLEDDGRLLVHLLDPAHGADGRTDPHWRHVEIAWRLEDDDALLTIAHEIFHRIQYRYNATTARDRGLYGMMREGGARLAEDWVVDAANRYLRQGGDSMFAKPGGSLVEPGDPTKEAHRYTAGLFWRYVCEQHGRERAAPSCGFDAYRHALIHMRRADGVPAPYTVDMLRRARAAMAGAGHLDRFAALDEARRELVCTETTWGNFLLANLLHAGRAGQQDARFQHRDLHEEPVDPAIIAMRMADEAQLGPAPLRWITPLGNPLAPFAAAYYRIIVPAGAGARLLQLRFDTVGLADPLVQVVLLADPAADAPLLDIQRFDRPRFSHTLALAALPGGADVREVVVVVGARERGFHYSLRAQLVERFPLVSATRWNCAPGTGFETNPADGWRWTSPDLGLAGAGDDAVLRLRLRNLGDRACRLVRARFFRQPADQPLTAEGWSLIEGTLGSQPADLELEAAQEAVIELPWRVPGDPAAWCVKAEIEALGDPTAAGKVILAALRPDGLRLPAFRDTVLDVS